MIKGNGKYAMRHTQSPQTGLQALLIDLDNCPRQIEQLPQTLADFARVIACYGGAEPKVPLSLVPFLATAIQQGKLEIIGMKKKGRNAADFGLAFWAGRLMAEMPADTMFSILSQDSDLDHVVHLLQSANRRVARIGDQLIPQLLELGEVPDDPADALVEGVVDEATVAAYVALHLKPGRSRPAKKITLSNSIQSFLRNHKKTVTVAAVLQGLQDRGLLRFDAYGRVIYLMTAAVEEPAPAGHLAPAVELAPAAALVPAADPAEETLLPSARPLFNGEGVVPF